MTKPDRDWLDKQIASMVDEGEQIDPDESLIMYGLDSIRVMEFVSALQQHGISASFEELISQPTANAWWDLLQSRAGVTQPG